MANQTLFLIDGHALVYRSHYAFIRRPLINSKGINTSSISGFIRTIWEILKDKQPDYLAVAFDPKGPTFRHDHYDLYKANRDKQPEDIQVAIPLIKELLEAFNIPVITMDGYEADDVIGTLATRSGKEGITTYMVTPDKDYAQLVKDNVFMYKPLGRGDGYGVLGVNEIKENWGINNPDQVIDFLAIQGDSSDNIPGVKGIGPKGAKTLLKKYESLEGIYENIDKITGRTKTLLEESKENAFLSKYLATIKLDVPIELTTKDFSIKPLNKEKLSKLFSELEFRSLAKTILGEQEKQLVQTSLFGSPDKSSTVKEENKPQEKEYQVVKNNFQNSNKEYILVNSTSEIDNLIITLKKQKEFAFDVETSELNPNMANLVGMSFAFEDNKAYYVPVDVKSDDFNERILKFKDVLEDKSIIKIGQNIKYDSLVMKWHGVDLQGQVFDTMIAHYLIEPDLRHKLDYLSESYLKYKMVPIEELIGKKGKGQLSMSDIPVEKVKDYAAEDADITYQLKNLFDKELGEENLQKVFTEIEMPLVNVLKEMEYNGVFVDKEFLNNYSKVLQKQIIEKEKGIYEEAGVKFNISSPKQVGEVLFEKLEIPYRWKKTSSGQFSTSEEKLSELAVNNEIIHNILNYRKLRKLKNTYVDALPKLINPKTNRIHSSFNQARAATGRLSSENPNMQNIPIRDEAGREIRKAFKPRNEDFLLLAADYSQIELRLIADMSGEKAMLDAFNQGMDIHKSTAAKVFGVPIEDVTSDQRRQAKTINFSIIYGAGATNLSRQLGISRPEAKKLIESYFREYSGLEKFFEETVQFARDNGYVLTQLGRKRKLRDINSRNGLARSNAERMAINTPVQGTAADMIKLAMISIQKELKAQNLKSKMILQVHDELIFDMHKSEQKVLKELVIEKMTNAMSDLNVNIKVDTGIGENWLEAH